MKNLMHYARQLRQRRINTFHFSLTISPQQQLPLPLPPAQNRMSKLRRMSADQEYDTDDDPQ